MPDKPIIAKYKGKVYENLHLTTIRTLISFAFRGLIKREETQHYILYTLPEPLP